ncbi:hypothetical protein [Methanopyrus sp. KOL6]|uniref:hypothetical protein n=1 Tax=Methanopyrus sp. KOL6 TaxID=1937004 RepID=UPI0018DFEFA7|nr:hypothetical protein [Methanopyrus sp. KOL6]
MSCTTSRISSGRSDTYGFGQSTCGMVTRAWSRLAEQPRERVLKLARIAARHLRTALEMSREACAVRRLIVRTQALAFDLEPACSTGLRGQLERAQRS